MASSEIPVNQYYICHTCGTQFSESQTPPEHCPICDDERQYVGHDGQQWTTLESLQREHHNKITEEDDDLLSIQPIPKCGIGQRAFLIRTPGGNVLWDCVPLIDDASIDRVRAFGGIDAIAISHPHYYSAMVEWSRAFGNAPIHIHENDAQWIMRSDKAVQLWKGDTLRLFDGLTLVRTGGHFDGFQTLYWRDGAEGRGALFVGDQPFVCMDPRWVSFMYSYPNMIPLAPAAVRQVVARLEPFAFDRIYGAFAEQRIETHAKEIVRRSAERYIAAVTR